MNTVLLLVLSAVCSLVAFVILSTRMGHPHHRKLAGMIYGAGWIPFLISVISHRQWLSQQRDIIDGVLSGYTLHWVLLVFMVLCGYFVRTLFPDVASSLKAMNPAELDSLMQQDLSLLQFMNHKIGAIGDELCSSGLLDRSLETITADDRQRLKASWMAYVEASVELDLLKLRHRSFYLLSPISDSRRHIDSFLIAYGAFVTQYHAELQLTSAVGSNDAVKTILNEAVAENRIPAGSYLSIQRRSVHPDTVVRLNAGRAYLKLNREKLLHHRGLLDGIGKRLQDVDAAVLSGEAAFRTNPLDYFENKAFDAWFPLQKGVAVQISFVRAATREYFIRPEQVSAYAGQLQPGDILVQRREWHLTNLGIPGYWTHGALYIGTLDLMNKYFEGLPELGGKTVAAYLETHRPAALAALLQPDEKGHRLAVIEALRPGVILQSLEKSGSCDSLAALRANVSRSEQFQVVIASLTHLGKPYDYNFDFNTDNELVCSELIVKAYEGIAGVSFSPTILNGRLLLSPNDMVRSFDEAFEQPDRQMRCCLFLDGRDIGDFEERDGAALRQSWSRPKWHILVN